MQTGVASERGASAWPHVREPQKPEQLVQVALAPRVAEAKDNANGTRAYWKAFRPNLSTAASHLNTHRAHHGNLIKPVVLRSLC
eukprot:1260882-Pleurochrysis_carterae.AAC.2